MIAQYLPGFVMLGVTIAFVSLCFLPATLYPRKNAVANFYWGGIWVFLGVIAALSGGNQTLRGFNYDADRFSDSLLFTIAGLFVFFVVFGWFRLSSVALFYGAKRLWAKFT